MAEPLTVADVEAAIERVLSEARSDYWSAGYDPEDFHARHDSLYGRILTAIADERCTDPVGCARAALRLASDEFSAVPRWYA